MPQLLDYDAARTKARKLIEKPSDDASKLPIAERQAEEAREVFEVLNQQLLNDLPILLDLRVNFLDPSFESSECLPRSHAVSLALCTIRCDRMYSS